MQIRSVQKFEWKINRRQRGSVAYGSAIHAYAAGGPQRGHSHAHSACSSVRRRLSLHTHIRKV